jgi:DNA-binding CsgD family transcriptional regulator
MLGRARDGQSEVLVIRGEAGVGKSALLGYLVDQASAWQIARAVGVESETGLAFAGLHQLCAPFRDRLERLPGPQRDSLRTAFGLDAGEPDPFLVGLAALGLLSEVAEERPLVCVIDDLQWQDPASAQAFTFVARRLLAEPIAFVFAVREPSDTPQVAGLREMVLRGLSRDDAGALVESLIPGRLDDRVREQILAAARGNPLAILDLARGLTAAELAGGFALPARMSLGTPVEQSFLRRLASLPSETQRLLVTAAAEPVGDVTVLWRAAHQLGLGADAAAPAEAAGLIELGARIRFCHPLVRSAAYRAATADERQEAHRALARVTDPQSDPDRRAWHRACAAVGPDESVAAELERSAERARARGGVAAAAAFLGRATELTPDPVRRAGRALTAAEVNLDAGALDTALEFLAAADAAQLEEVERVRRARLRARISFVRTRGADAARLLLDAARLLLDAAKRLDPFGPVLAREACLEALGAVIFAGRLVDGSSAETVAVVSSCAPPAGRRPRALDLLLDALATRFTKGYVAAAPALRRALDALVQEGKPGDRELLSFGPACLVAPDLWDNESWDRLSGRAVALAREAGALTLLPVALTACAGVRIHAGEFTAAAALVAEADAISAATGSAPLTYGSLLLAAWRGDKVIAQELIDASYAHATAGGEGRAIGMAEHASAVLHNGLGQYEAALAAARRACEHDDPGVFGWSLAELVEAAARSGACAEAAVALTRFEERTAVAGTNWALGMQARLRALLSDAADADALYREAIDRLERTRIVVHVARAQLLYGEWLRREQRRVDAREQLRRAHETFSRIGARAFAERAGRELAATGEAVLRRSVDTRDRLTAHEAQIARLAAAGHTNPEIGAQLFISPRTVEYHLHKVFAKLDISSRRELRAALPDDHVPLSGRGAPAPTETGGRTASPSARQGTRRLGA